MIVNPGFKNASFVNAIACTIGRSERARVDDADIERAMVRDDGVLYISLGYWRAQLQHNGQRIYGLRLINPDRTPAEISLVERGIAVLCHYPYSDGPS